jgi:drug/metabolite transporter (DMT)-like permease
MIGAGIIVGRDFMVHSALGMGDLLGLVAGFFYGLFFLAAERARERLTSLAALWISIAGSTLVLGMMSVVLGQPFTGYPIRTYANLGALALVVQVAGWFAINFALGHLPASLVSSTLLAQPVLTAFLAVPFLEQPLVASQIAGGAIALVGILIVHRSK